jgi:hypothetical protein
MTLFELTMEAKALYERVLGYIETCKGQYSDWYVGITNNPQERFTTHGVHSLNHPSSWICSSENVSRGVEEMLLKLGLQGGPGGGVSNDPPVYLYVYRNLDIQN